MRIGIDLGGTKIAGALVANGKIVKRAKVPTEKEKGRQHICNQITRVINTLRKGQKITHIGFGVPGYARGTKIISLTNLHELDGFDLKRSLQLTQKVSVLNDADCFVLGEHKFGEGMGKTIVGITLGTGVGSGVILNGQLLSGKRRKSPELGLLMVDIRTKKYAEGVADWESLISGSAIVKRHKRNSGKTQLADTIWKARDRASKKTRSEINTMLAIFCANIVRMFDPDCIILGGGASNAQMVKDVNALMPSYDCDKIVKLSRLKEQAAMLGAAYGH